MCINCSLTVSNGYFKSEQKYDEYGSYRVLFSLFMKNRLFLPFNLMIMLISVFVFILFHAKSEDTIILYHSIYYDGIVRSLKNVKKYNLIYEVEEIYADVRDNGVGAEKEIIKCEKYADSFIFPTEILNLKINIYNKPYLIIYGAYKPVDCIKIPRKKTIIVYSGTFMPGKGASQAIACANELNDNYEIRIIGYGNDNEKKKIMNDIDLIHSKCKVIFDGMKIGAEYTEYLGQCDIGLCVQPKENLFNTTSFPSKILSYLNCGLKVVTSDLEAVKKSKLAECICFSIDDTPANVVDAIKQANSKEIMASNVIKKLDSDLKDEVRILMNKYRISSRMEI